MNTMMTGTTSHYLTKDQVAERLGLTRRGVECLVLRRAIPVIKLSGRCVRFDWRKVEAALEKFEQRAL